MTSRERFLTAALRQKPDKVPAAPYNGNFGAALAGIPLSRYSSDPALMAAAHIKTREVLGHDVVVAQSDQYYIAEGFGCVINQPHDITPNLVKPAVETLDEIGRLKVPDPYKDGRMHVYLDAVNKLREHFGNEVAVRGPATGPFSLASYLAGGMEYFLMEIATAEADGDTDKERKLLDLMEISSDTLIVYLQALLEAGSDVAQLGDSLASLSMISPAIYEKYVYPFECKVFTAILPRAREKGAVTLLHICGDTRKILPLMAKTGADILEIDSLVDMAEAKALTGGNVALMGNLDPSAVLLQGTPADVRTAALACMKGCDALSGGFILGSGCEVAPKTPPENLKTLVEAAHGFTG
ncbi:MAG: uroporphyrinogen decarboxylase family protein [Spirochaetaceae bacterium]|nr:uroporphyrinogen decarboxylase family protein [Spirochaetaceae bacterium]